MGIKEVAEAANVSVSTVSLVLNEKRGVGEETRRRVLEIAAAQNYVPPRNRALPGERKGNIRFLKVTKHGHVLNDSHRVFIADYIEGLAQGCKEADFHLQVSEHRVTDLGRFTRPVTASSLSGFVVLGTELDEQDLAPLEHASAPVVVIDAYFDCLRLDFVDMDNVEALHQVVAHFLQHGRTDIGYIRATTVTRNLTLRENALVAALQRFGLRAREDAVFTADCTFDGAYRDMLAHLRDGRRLPQALFTGNDITAYGCVKALREHGVRVPEDVSVIGFDDLPSSSVVDPPLTTVRVHKRQIGRMAVSLLSHRIDEPGAATVKVQIGGELIVRDSVG